MSASSRKMKKNRELDRKKRDSTQGVSGRGKVFGKPYLVNAGSSLVALADRNACGKGAFEHTES